MINRIDMDKNGQDFLLELFKCTQGKSSVQVSMYDLGASLGMDRQESSRITENLIALNFVEIRGLSGSIAISEEGISEAKKIGGVEQDNEYKLGQDPVIDEKGIKAVNRIIEDLKSKAGNMGLDFDDLNEFTADIKTIDAQMTSSKPKTSIIRECFKSIEKNLKKTKAKENIDILKSLLEG